MAVHIAFSSYTSTCLKICTRLYSGPEFLH